MPDQTHIGDGRRPYEPPRLTEFGTLHDLTLQIQKTFGPSDGFVVDGNPIKNVSP